MKLMISATLLSLMTWLSELQLPDQRSVINGLGEAVGRACDALVPDAVSVFPDRRLQLLVWNTQKQQADDWQQEFSQLAANADLVMFQEAKLPLHSHNAAWQWQQSWAFSLDDTRLGVASSMRQLPLNSCGMWHQEPWLGTDKTALVSSIATASGESLLVVNLHSVNFSWDLAPYQSQLRPLFELIATHQGPVLLAGDFNSWRAERLQFLQQQAMAAGLQQAEFLPDHRTRVFGYPLDHIFYRQLKLVRAQSFLTKNSDHAPLLADFVIE